jgi:hypothetical protein
MKVYGSGVLCNLFQNLRLPRGAKAYLCINVGFVLCVASTPVHFCVGIGCGAKDWGPGHVPRLSHTACSFTSFVG